MNKFGVLTSGDVAKLLDVAHTTANRLLDEKKIRCWRVPGSSHRRTTLEEVKRYADREGIRLKERHDAETKAG